MSATAPLPSSIGLLDKMDMRLGLLSEGSDENGKRRRSFGVTVFFWLCLPGLILILSTSVAQILVAWNTGNTVPLALVISYQSCIKKAQNLKATHLCKLPQVKPGKSIAKGILELGWPPWIFCLALAGIGFAAWLIRDEQYLRAFIRLSESLSVYATAGKSPPAALTDALSTVASKLGTATPAPGSPEAIEKAKAAPAEDPGPPPAEKTSL